MYKVPQLGGGELGSQYPSVCLQSPPASPLVSHYTLHSSPVAFQTQSMDWGCPPDGTGSPHPRTFPRNPKFSGVVRVEARLSELKPCSAICCVTLDKFLDLSVPQFYPR